jgi:hypothetical protein
VTDIPLHGQFILKRHKSLIPFFEIVNFFRIVELSSILGCKMFSMNIGQTPTLDCGMFSAIVGLSPVEDLKNSESNRLS